MPVGCNINEYDISDDTYDDNSISPAANRDWLEEEGEYNISPFGNKGWLEGEDED